MNVFQMAFGWQQPYKTECRAYFLKIARFYITLPVYGFVVTAVNFAIYWVVKHASKWMKMRDLSAEAMFQTTLVFALQFFNMTFPLLMLNLNFESNAWIRKI